MLKHFRLEEIIRFFRFVKPRAKRYLIGLLGNSACEASAAVILPIIIMYMINATLTKNRDLLWIGLKLAIVEGLVVSVLFIITQTVFWKPTIKIVADIKVKMFGSSLHFPMSYFDSHHSGEIISRQTNDVNVFYNLYSFTLNRLLVLAFSGIGSVIIMFVLDWRFGLVLMGSAVVSTYINSNFLKGSRTISDKLQMGLADLTEKMSDTLSGFTVVRMLGLDKKMEQRFNKDNTRIQSLNYERSKQTALLSAINFVISWINYIGVIAFGAYLSFYSTISMGVLLAEISLLGNVNTVIKSLPPILIQMQSDLAGTQRVVEHLEMDQESAKYGHLFNKPTEAYIAFDKVSFQYGDTNTLTDVNFSVKAGVSTAIVGKSGAGKSTIAKILLGFYPPSSGNITIVGKSLGQYTLAELRSQIAFVPQDTYLFDGTIEDNIRLGKPDATFEEVERAAKLAYADEFIVNLEQKYNTPISEGGRSLSGGQRQRIAIARAIIKESPIILFDEATAALDSLSEVKVQSAIRNLAKQATVLTIAHRLSTIKEADQIIVMDKGMVVEIGKHMVLVERKGIYYELFGQSVSD